jgi:hypothetical protein
LSYKVGCWILFVFKTIAYILDYFDTIKAFHRKIAKLLLKKENEKVEDFVVLAVSRKQGRRSSRE